jgi:short-subunit dehydrogenase
MKKNCWIIGASHGVGEAISNRFYRDEYDVIISARSSEKLEELKKKMLELRPGNVLVSVMDVSNIDSVRSSFLEVLQKFQKIDLVIFCPALYQPMSVINFDLDISKKIIDVNLVGFLNFLHLVVPQMVQQKSGQIAVIASVAGYCGLPQSFAYGASKAALINLCE